VFKNQLVWLRTLGEEAFGVTLPPSEHCDLLNHKQTPYQPTSDSVAADLVRSFMDRFC